MTRLEHEKMWAIEDTLEAAKYEIQAICSESILFAKSLDGGSEFLLLRCRLMATGIVETPPVR